jgi:tetratricopeptide (TPR) repeat protein/DNA-binding transcriptional ArsR family regulator
MLPSASIPQTVREDATAVTTIAVVLDAALDAYRAGTTEAFVQARPGGLRWATRRFLQPILGTAGDALPIEHHQARALEWLLIWAITQLRPDRAPTLEITDRQCWLERTSWRPAIAIMCHYGFAPVPEFRDRYYRRQGESPADNLCGLWNIGQSTFYRYVEKGKRLMGKLLHEHRLDQRHAASLRDFVQRQVCAQHTHWSREEDAAWHRQQAIAAMQTRDFLSALWHLRLAREFDQINALIHRNLVDLVGQPEFEQHLDALRRESFQPAQHIRFLLAEAAVSRARNQADQERSAYEQALQLAVDANDALATGVVYGELGKYYEPRDADRAFAYYQDSAEFFSRAESDMASASVAGFAGIGDAHVGTLTRLAWLYTLRNDPRARAVLEKAEAAHALGQISDATSAMLEQAWGEYCRRAGQLQEALEHRQRALNIYERLRDQEGVIKAYLNLGLVYVDLGRFEQASHCFDHVLRIAESTRITPELAASAHLNSGIALFWQNQLDQAIKQYQLALAISASAGLKLWMGRAHHNLAEAYYIKFRDTAEAIHEQAGDSHVISAIAAFESAESGLVTELTRKLKGEILGRVARTNTDDRLLPQETAAHFVETSAVEKNRATLAAPGKPEEHIRAHLAIANAYLAISAKEREQALALIDKHGLRDQFAGEFAQLRATYERELTREQKLAAQWKSQAGEFINDERRAAVLAHLIQHGVINKSAYAETCGVGLATASKHLVMLAERGLVQQVGKGPSTRYMLPNE